MRRIFAIILGLGLTSSIASAQNAGQGSLSQLQSQIDKQQDEIRQLRGQVEELLYLVKKQQQQVEQSAAFDKSAPKPPVIPQKPHPEEVPLVSSSILAGQSTSSGGSQPQGSGNSVNDYNEARTLLEQRNFAEAEVALTHFIKKYPKDPMLVNATYWLAETYYIRSDYAQAALKFGEAYQAYLDHKNSPYKEQALSKGPEIIFKLASSLYNIGKYKDAKLTLEELNSEFPKLPGNIRSQVDVLKRELSRKATQG